MLLHDIAQTNKPTKKRVEMRSIVSPRRITEFGPYFRRGSWSSANFSVDKFCWREYIAPNEVSSLRKESVREESWWATLNQLIRRLFPGVSSSGGGDYELVQSSALLIKWLLPVLILALSTTAFTQDGATNRPRVKALRLEKDETISIDARLNESVW